MTKFGVAIVEDAETGHEVISVITDLWVENRGELDKLTYDMVGEAVWNELALVIEDENADPEEEDAEE
jgi:hypothetical protein